jgi:class 3 adenylate cyclase
VQGLATSQAIFVTSAVVDDKNSANILAARRLQPVSQDLALRGIERDVRIFAIPEELGMVVGS